MPTMPRFSKKGTKVAYKLLGTPPNILYKPSPQSEKIRKELLFQETTRSR